MESGNILGYGIPEDIFSDIHVIVDDPVTHSNYRMPGDLRMSHTSFIGNTPGGLTNNLD